uniref:nostrin-like isoform X2 n=1 Tax=Podarcis muralis TaxID=64176 RepID=UPI00109FE837|nr:nostrin-like isoform X2 [Podarcis muralis]
MLVHNFRVSASSDVPPLLCCTIKLTFQDKEKGSSAKEEDATSLIEKERRQASIKAKVLRVQKDLEKALQDKAGLERMLNAYTESPQFSDAKNQNDITEQLDETSLKVILLHANHFKLATVLAEIEQMPKPVEPRNCISKWKEKDCVHHSVAITRPVKKKHFKQTLSTGATSEEGINRSCPPGKNTIHCRISM